MNCDAAKALNKWVNKGVKPAIGGGPAVLGRGGIFLSYPQQPTRRKVSEHGKGKAIDISQLTLVNGKTPNVLSHWGKGAEGQLLAKMHKSACGPFGTVLGPNTVNTTGSFPFRRREIRQRRLLPLTQAGHPA